MVKDTLALINLSRLGCNLRNEKRDGITFVHSGQYMGRSREEMMESSPWHGEREGDWGTGEAGWSRRGGSGESWGRSGGGVECMCEGTLVMGTGVRRPSKECKGTASVTTRVSSSIMVFSRVTGLTGSLATNIGGGNSASPGSHMEAAGKVKFDQYLRKVLKAGYFGLMTKVSQPVAVVSIFMSPGWTEEH